MANPGGQQTYLDQTMQMGTAGYTGFVFEGNSFDPYSGTGFPQQSQSYYHPLSQHGPVYNEPVATHSDNYIERDRSMLTELNNKIATLEEQFAEANKIVQSMKAAQAEAQAAVRAVDRKNELKKKTQTTRLHALVHSKTRWSLGVGGVDLQGNKLSALPHPLQPGQDAEMLEDGETKKAHPNWHSGVSDPTNLRFCHSMANLCMEEIEIDNKSHGSRDYGNPTMEAVLKACKSFFGELRKKYQAQTTEEGRLRLEKKRINNRRRSRKGEKADDRRTAVPAFRERHGEENTVGDYEAIQTDDMSSEHSDCGKVDRARFDERRRASGAGNDGWERRRKCWRSGKINIFFAHLDTIHAAALEEAKKASGSAAGRFRAQRFKGFPENWNNNAPVPPHARKISKSKGSKGVLYESMVSDSWLQKTGKTYKEIGAVPDPEAFTLFKLSLDKVGLNATEVAYLADDEA